MRSRNLLKALPAAVLAAVASLAPTHDANATAYAYSFDDIFNLVVASTPAGAVDSVAANSQASATLNGSGVSTQDNTPITEPGRASAFDALPSQVGIALANNTFGPQAPGFPGVLPGTNFARGDSIINQTAINPLPPFNLINPSTRAQNVAEANVNGGNTAGADAGNDSSTQLTFTVGAGGATFSFNLDADPLMRVATQGVGESALARLAVGITITPVGSNIPVFIWAPDGLAGGILGGVETSDPFSLNTQISQLTPGSTQYDPAAGHFAANTFVLPAGSYRVDLGMTERVAVISPAAVPEPATISLLGLALAGLGFGSRRKKVAAS